MSKTKKLTIMALFVTIGVIINWFSNLLPETLGKISLVYTFCYLVGIFLGPIPGAIVAMVSDIICFFMAPTGHWIPQVTLSNGLMAFITGAVFKYAKFDFIWKLLLSSVLSLIFCSAGLTAWGLSMFYKLPKITSKYLGVLGNSSYLVWALAQLIRQPFIILMNLIVTTFTYHALESKVVGVMFYKPKTKISNTEINKL